MVHGARARAAVLHTVLVSRASQDQRRQHAHQTPRHTTTSKCILAQAQRRYMSSLKPPDSAFRTPAIPKPIPDRGPPGRSQSSQSRTNGNSLAVPQTPQALPLTSRGKVALKPGHSPLDWARLCHSEDLRGVSSFMRVTPSELAKHARRSQGVWMALGGRVYNCSRYIDFHPGGAGQLLRGAGKDATQLFMETHAWVNFEGMLEKCLIGILVPEPEPGSSDDSD